MVVDKQNQLAPSKGALELEAVPPGDVFVHVWEHPANVELIEGDPRARLLDKKALKALQQEIKNLRKQLESSIYYRAVAAVEKRRKKALELQVRLNELNDAAEPPNPRRVEMIEAAIKSHQERADTIYRKIIKLRRVAVQLDRAEKRLGEHEIAVANEKLYEKLRQEMKNEVHFFASQCVERWAALGYHQVIHMGKERVVRRVQFEKCVVTPDSIQFKIKVSDLTLLRAVHHHLPHGVRIADLVSEETLAELSAACQRPVTSPHGDEEKDFSNGGFIEIHRLGMNDGLFNYIRLSDMLIKYNQGERERYPFPIGIRRGRVAQFGYLDSQPHAMFNGITGSGKTNAIRSILTTLIQYHSPSELRLFITDLKRGADFINFKDLPHIEGDVITDIDALETLCWQLVGMMMARMSQIAKRAVYDIKAYNASVSPDAKMARVVVVIDECAAIKSLSEKDQNKSIWRALGMLATQARAAGIHLFLGTQQSFKESIPPAVRDNITLVFSGRQRTLAASMGTFGDGKAKNLPAIPGRMYCYDGELYMIQTPFATHEDIAYATKIASQWDKPQPLDLPTDAVAMPEPIFSEETVVNMALNDFEGKLAARLIYEKINSPDVSRSAVFEIVKQIAANPTYQYNGTEYDIKKDRNTYKLVPKIPTSQLPTH